MAEVKYNSLKQEELFKLTKQRGLNFPPDALKKDLIAALEESDGAEPAQTGTQNSGTPIEQEQKKVPASERLTPQQMDKAQNLKATAEELGLVLVDPSFIEEMRSNMASMAETIKAQGNQIVAVADKSRLQKYDQANATPLERVVRISVFNDDGRRMRILAWSDLIVDQVYKNQNGTWVENQIVSLILQDLITKEVQEPRQIPYTDFVKKTEKMNATIRRKLEDEKGNLILNVVDEDGDEFDISATFVN